MFRIMKNIRAVFFFTPTLFFAHALLGQSRVAHSEIDRFFENLEHAGYFKFVKDTAEIDVWRTLERQHLTEGGWMYFPNRDWILETKAGRYLPGTFESFDYRTLPLDANDLFRGGLATALQRIRELFQVRGLTFEVRDETMDWGEKDVQRNYHYFKHAVYINDRQIVFADGNLNRMNGLMYLKKLMEVIRFELTAQHSPEKAVLLSIPDGVVLLIAEEPVVKVLENLPEGFENEIVKE